MLNTNNEYRKLKEGLLFLILFFNVSMPLFSEELEEEGPQEEEQADVENFLHHKTEKMFKEYNDQERFFEHTYFYYHQNLERLNRSKKKRPKDHPFFAHYRDCLDNQNQNQNHCLLLSQVFTDALWDLDARWRQMKTSGIRYRRRPSKHSPILIYVQYLFEQQNILNELQLPDQLRLNILGLKNEVIDKIAPEKEAQFVELIEDIETKKELDDLDIGALKAAYYTIIDGPLLISKEMPQLVDSALQLQNESLDLLKEVLLPDYGPEYLQLEDKEEKTTAEINLKELLTYEPQWEEIQKEEESLRPTGDASDYELQKWKYLERLLKYSEGPRLFVLCRQNREYACLMLMRNEKGEWAKGQGKNKDNWWSHRAMASSNKGWSFYKRLGHTPAGIYTIDGVMPFNNRRQLFGKFHRLILNYLPGNASDLSYNKLMIPLKNQEEESWWKQAPLAKTLGRNLLRIHGTGKKARRISSYYPLVKTNGCISQIEGKYGKKLIQDQKDLINELQRMQNIKRMSEIKGLLYVIEIDNQESEVTLSEIINKLELE